jgi:serine/threonine-protein kinase HipA
LSILQISLNGLPVGTLAVDRHGVYEFRLLESYRNAYPRPVLGQVFLDDLEQVYRSSVRLPTWFSNLLPEGPLRSLLAEQAGLSPEQEFQLLGHLGQDLPGAVRAQTLMESGGAGDDWKPSAEESPSESLHFSLAGVQLKFSAHKGERGLTIPASGLGGNWIVKLPDQRYREVPRNEYATMLWARASGLEVPDVELVLVSDIENLPKDEVGLLESHALAVRRFDRHDNGTRVHIEDFAQILDLYPQQKYQRYNYESLAKVILSTSGIGSFNEFISRLVFIIASGNGDAHHKNWSLIYRDPSIAELSPAYDLVSTIQYLPEDRLALNLAKSKDWKDIGIESFQRLARKIDVDEKLVETLVRRAVESVLDAWKESASDFGYDSAARQVMERHMRRVPLLFP